MNRAERRKNAREQRTYNIGSNSDNKLNYTNLGQWEIPVDKITVDEHLKADIDSEVLDLFREIYNEWMGTSIIKNNCSKAIIMLAMDYLDTLSSLKFGLVPMEDRIYIRDTVYHMANTVNFFMGTCNVDGDKSLEDRVAECFRKKEKNVNFPVVVNTGLEFTTLPNSGQINNMYANFLVGHANELDPFLVITKPSEISGDEEYVFKILNMIVNQSIKLSKEIEIPSRKYIVEL